MSARAGRAWLRIASYNTRDLLDDEAAAARVVRAIDPDVLCLQEVPRRLLAVSRVSSFASRCGMYWTADLRGSGGTTVFTSLRVDVEDVVRERLPVPAGRRRRGFVAARVRLPGGAPVTVASVHLGLDPAERLRHTRRVLERLGGAGELVVAGDLNEGTSGASWQALAVRLRLVSPTAPTYPAAAPRHLLDVVFASPGVQVLAPRPLALDRADLLAASDHLPTWADITLDPAGPGASRRQ